MDKKQALAEKTQRQQELVNAAKEAGRTLNDAERAEFDALQKGIDALNREIAEAEQAAGQRREPEATPAPPSAATEAEQRRAVQEAVRNERRRSEEISALCRDFGMEPGDYIRSGATVEEVRTAIVERLRKDKAPITTAVRVVDSGEDEFRADAANGLLLRGGIQTGQAEQATEGARQFSRLSFRDLAIECLERDGFSGARRLDSSALYTEVFNRQYFNPTAAFPAILDNAIEKAYVQGHRTVPVTFDQWTKKGSLKDFKTHDNNYLAGPVGEFLEVPEGGELKNDIATDAKRPTRKLKTYGKQFTLSRQAFINDDIDLVTRIPARYAAAARKTINTQCYRILMNNPTIYDGLPLFSTNHRNLLPTGTKITQAAVQSMIMALATQKDEFEQAIIVRPAAIIVPAGYAFDIYTLFNSPTIQTTDNTQAVNPLYRYKDSISIIEDPTINQMAGGFGSVMPWFMTAAREDSDFIEVDYLNGQEIPTIRRMETPGQLGFVWDIYLDWGINPMDYRGCIKNPGVTVADPLS